MANLTENTTIKRLQNKYRLVVMNDDTFEEVVTFKLSRVSVYIALSSTFVILVGFTVCLLVFTPLKYYIPGYGNKKSLTQLQLLKTRTDSLEQAIRYKEQYMDGFRKAITGNGTMVLDSTAINVLENENQKLGSKKKEKDMDQEPRRKKRRRRD
ncbi:MAG: hypothetical protein ACOVO1_03020 [Chitinophagaceae bacterium]